MKKIWVFLACGLFLAACSLSGHERQKSDAPHHTIMEDTSGTTVTMNGHPLHTSGRLPAVGTQAPDFTLTATDLSEKSLKDYLGKNVILNIFISVNTGVCSASVHAFNKDAADLKNTVVLCISKDLPFAQKEFCGAAGIHNVVMLSDFRDNFGKIYGVQLTDGRMRGLLSRAVVVINPKGKIVYEQQVPELSHQPDYAAALAAVQSAGGQDR